MKKIVGSVLLSIVLITGGVSIVNGITAGVPSNTVNGNTRTIVFTAYPSIGKTERVFAQVGSTKNYSAWKSTGLLSARASGNKSLSNSFGSESK
ncbi:hypothetical protein [Enterococcus sp.]|uniref:hypothetical protein n=1 Tax=Enterococcus sp. TaxID=35783 RepID=UPI0028AB823C|nr:hypothetical protein [Enterococcus sp.]